MSELRWNALLGEWTVTATHRQERTFLPPAEFCPLCPTRSPEHATEVPAPDYDIVVFENRFPSLSLPAPDPSLLSQGLFEVMPANGRCEVVVYTSQHDTTLAAASLQKLRSLIEVWIDRFEDLSAQDAVEYVLIFENKGEVMGVTLAHPHGQIYAYPFIPPMVAREIARAGEYRARNGTCLFCAMVEAERSGGSRIVGENAAFIAFVPFAARYPFEVHIYPKRHSSGIPDLTSQERDEFASILKSLLVAYDKLYDRSFPYVMAFHQRPAKTRGGTFHWHLEFYPPMRSADKLKILAGSELAAGMFINDSLPEEKAAELRAVWPVP